jgi:hypothetical protein
MFSVKGFAAGKNATPFFGSAAVVIVASSIAATVAVTKRSMSNVELRISAIEKLLKEGSTRETGKEPIEYDWQNFPLWIKVHLTKFPQ